MGLEITREDFSDEDYARFRARLVQCLAVLRRVLSQPGFGEGPATLGAELEVSLVDGQGHPLPLNRQVMAQALDPRLTVELDRFNLECNLRYGPLAGRPFAHLRQELEHGLAVIDGAAAKYGGRAVPVGILPTLRPQDLGPEQMTDSHRYRVLSTALRRARARPFHFHIDGAEPFELDRDDLTFEGAATSLQVHLRVTPAQFVDTYNAAQLATGYALAASGNSPTFLGHRLWHETRIALFKQAVDGRTAEQEQNHVDPRVDFGAGWLEGSVVQLYEQAASHDVLLPVCSDESPDAMTSDAAPRLEELRLHQGTVWSWNRPVYDPSGGGHLRIELRALPAGPTVIDMLANVAFLVGLTAHFRESMPALCEAMPFEQAERNFYRAAQQGLDAELSWPDSRRGIVPRRARGLLPDLVPLAREGLERVGVAPDDGAPWLEVFAERCSKGQTGASWQLAALARHEAAGRSRHAALQHMLEEYLTHHHTGAPVHAWPLPGERHTP